MNIVSWNVNSIRARIENFIYMVSKHSPDIVLLQETRVDDSQFPFELLADCGYNMSVMGQKARNGVAIFSKHIIEDVRKDFCQEARYISCFTGGAFVASIYVPNGQIEGSQQYIGKLEFLSGLKERFLEYKDEVFVAGGDFNVAPYEQDTYIDGYSGVSCTPKERELIGDIRDAGFCDALHDKGYTWWDYRMSGLKRDHGFRIDHFYLSQCGQQLFEGGSVLRDIRELSRPSDHAPIICKLNINN